MNNFINIFYRYEHPTFYDYTDYKCFYSGIMDTDAFTFDTALQFNNWVVGEPFACQPFYAYPNTRVTATLYTCRDYMGCGLTTRLGYFSDCLVLETKTENYWSFLNGTARYWVRARHWSCARGAGLQFG